MDTSPRLAATLLALLSLALCAAATARDLRDSTSSIDIPRDGYKLRHTLHARGYQHYRFNGTAWVGFNATAKLYDQHKQEVGVHYFLLQADALGGRPTWESLPNKMRGVPRSRVTCKSVAQVAVEQESIPWVLLKSTGSAGDEKYFGGVAYVRRINTKHGLAPRNTKRALEGDVKKSAYACDYSFYVPA
ncbi:uncharacterized protein [Physcomitrium patens]|uniref:Uncharacterized protein n=1 Tax=Physcomitrium patens TaxID=3218 RepID=A0A2K1J3D6_PHYPA|nr:hypothetical protein PHYPA_021881 [Physcomitrium patens]PNR36033.1 hypothetical protein PHYPA_021883 [Physcomitrium patens]